MVKRQGRAHDGIFRFDSDDFHFEGGTVAGLIAEGDRRAQEGTQSI